RQALHHRPDLPPDLGVFAHVRRHHGRLGTEASRLIHRHGRAHAGNARDVAAGRDDAASPAAADDHRTVAQGWIVALLDRRIEGVAIDMRDGQFIVNRIGDDARRAALRTTPACRSGAGKAADAIATYPGAGVHSSSCARPPLNRSRPRITDAGVTFLWVAKAISKCSLAAR